MWPGQAAGTCSHASKNASRNPLLAGCIGQMPLAYPLAYVALKKSIHMQQSCLPTFSQTVLESAVKSSMITSAKHQAVFNLQTLQIHAKVVLETSATHASKPLHHEAEAAEESRIDGISCIRRKNAKACRPAA